MLLALLDESCHITLKTQALFVSLVDLLEYFIVELSIAIHSSSCASVLDLSFLSFDDELSVRVTLAVTSDDVLRLQALDLGQDNADIVDHDLTILIALEKEELFLLRVVVGVNGRHRDLFLNGHVVKLDDE